MPSNTDNHKSALAPSARIDQERCRSSRNSNQEKAQSALKNGNSSIASATLDQDQRHSGSQYDKAKSASNEYVPEKYFHENIFGRSFTPLRTALLRSYSEFPFGAEGFSKTTRELSSVLPQFVDQLDQLDPNANIVLCKGVA